MEQALDLTLIIVALIALDQGVLVALIQRTRKFAQTAANNAQEDRIHHSAMEWKLDQIGREVRGVKTDIHNLQERLDTHIDGGHSGN